jgi:hypothetical protein
MEAYSDKNFHAPPPFPDPPPRKFCVGPQQQVIVVNIKFEFSLSVQMLDLVL